MATFYGTVQGSHGSDATRTGSKESGIKASARSYLGSVAVALYLDTAGTAHATITAGKGSTANPARTLWSGPLAELVAMADYPAVATTVHTNEEEVKEEEVKALHAALEHAEATAYSTARAARITRAERTVALHTCDSRKTCQGKSEPDGCPGINGPCYTFTPAEDEDTTSAAA